MRARSSKTASRMTLRHSQQTKVIVLVDMDCFYVQVEQRKNPDLKGKPCAVVQYRQKYGGGVLLAIGYEARKFGVSRLIRGNEAIKKCPDIQLVDVPERRGKADLTRYREAGAEVIKVLSRFSECIERASVDEAFLDITKCVQDKISEMGFSKVEPSMLPSTHIAGVQPAEASPNSDNTSSDDLNDTLRDRMLGKWLERDGNSEDLSLSVGAIIANEMRNAVLQETGFTCSAGVSCNKMLAKLAAGMNKPNQQTILPMRGVPIVFSSTPIKKIRHLGGKLGEGIQRQFGVEKIGQLTSVERKKLEYTFGDKTGSWLYDLCRGHDTEPIRVKKIPLSVGCGKNFYGREKLTSVEQVCHWLHQLTEELVERLSIDKKENNRSAGLLTVHFHPEECKTALSRSCPILNLESAVIVKNAWSAMNKGRVSVPVSTSTNTTTPLGWSKGIQNLHLIASKFTQNSTASVVNAISSYFTKQGSQCTSPGSSAAGTSHDCDSTSYLEGNDDNTEIGSFSQLASPNLSVSYLTKLTDSQSTNCQRAECSDYPSASHEDKCISSPVPVSSMKFNVTCNTKLTPPYFTLADSPPSMVSGVAGCSAQSEKSDNKTQYRHPTETRSHKKPVSRSPSIADYFTKSSHERTQCSSTSTESEAGPSVKKRKLEFGDSLLTENDESSLYRACAKCGESIAVWKIQEHEDFHLALQLHNEEKQPVTGVASVNPSIQKTGNSPRNTLLKYIKKS